MKNNLVFIVLDSCRYDSFAAAKTPAIDRIGQAELRYSYASWTSPSHAVMLMGLMPHTSPAHVFASEVYKTEFVKWTDRLNIPDLSFKTFVPCLSLPKVLKDTGYRTIARVSMPVLNQFTTTNAYFDDYKLMPDHNDFAGMVREMSFSESQPTFFFFNLGETHYPYMLKGLPRVSGVHGIMKELGEKAATSDHGGAIKFFDPEEMKRLHEQQIRCVEYIDGVMQSLFEKAPSNTHFVITADHGECFGEDGYFGHGPVIHPKCFEVPFVEGMLGN